MKSHLSGRIAIHFALHGYDTREAGSMDVYFFQTGHKEIYRKSFIIFGW